MVRHVTEPFRVRLPKNGNGLFRGQKVTWSTPTWQRVVLCRGKLTKATGPEKTPRNLTNFVRLKEETAHGKC